MNNKMKKHHNSLWLQLLLLGRKRTASFVSSELSHSVDRCTEKKKYKMMERSDGLREQMLNFLKF